MMRMVYIDGAAVAVVIVGVAVCLRQSASSTPNKSVHHWAIVIIRIVRRKH